MRYRPITLTPGQAERFWSRVERGDPDACWLWPRPQANGYGKIFITTAAGIRQYPFAHRVAFTLVRGPIPPGLEVCHACDTPSCVNPAHLWLGTHQENHSDSARKQRRNPRRGERNSNSPLTPEKVRTMRADYGAGTVRQPALAARYGISQSAVSQIVNRKVWTHI